MSDRPISGKVKKIYDTLKSGGGDVGTEQEFNDWFLAQGDAGYRNRKSVFNTLKEGGADAGANYEEFRDWLGLHAVKPQQSVAKPSTTPSVQQPKPQPKPQPKKGAWKPTWQQRMAIQQQMDDFNNRMNQQRKDVHRRVSNVGKAMRTGGMGEGKLNPETGKFEQRYYTTTGEEVGNRLEQSRLNLAERDRWEATTEEGQAHHRKRMEDARRRQVEDLSSDIDMALADAKGRSVQQYTDYATDHPFMSAMLSMGGAASPGDLQRQTYEQVHRSDHIPTKEAERLHNEIVELEAAQRSMRDAKRIIGEADHNAQKGTLGKWLESSFAGGAARGFGQKLFDVDTWDFGGSDLSDAGALMTALRAYDRGEKLTRSQRMLLDAKAVELATDAYFGSEVGRGYKAGKVTAESIPFMLEMCINPAAGTGHTASSMMTRYALKRFGKQAVKNNVKKYAAAKVGARVAGDVVGAATMAATTGAIRTAADAAQRMNGQVKYDTDSRGKSVFAGHTEGDDAATAIGKAFANTTIENYSEMVGEYFAPVLGTVGKAVRKGMGKIGLESVGRFIDDVAASDVAKMVSDFEKHAKWNGMIGEYSEEVAGGIMNALVVGDQTLDTDPETGVFNLDNNIDTFLGVSLLGGFMSGVKAAGYRTPKYRARQQMKQADEAALQEFGGNQDAWGAIRNTLAFGNDEDVKSVLAEVSTSAEYSDEQKMSVFEYSEAVERYKGMLKGEEKNTSENQESTEDPAIQEEMANIAEQYGHEADAQERQDIAIELAEANNAEAQEAWNGVVQRINEDAAYMVAQQREQTKQMQHTDGSLRPAILKEKDSEGNDQQVYIVDGNVQMMPDGSMVDKASSDNIVVVYNPVTGERKQIDPSADTGISSLGEVTTAEQREADIERSRQEYVQAQIDEAQGTVRFVPGQQLVLPTGEEAVVVATDADGENITVALGDGTQATVQRSELQRIRDEEAIADYQERHGIDEAAMVSQHTEQPQAGADGRVAGAPADYTADMELTIRDEDGSEKPAMVMGRVRAVHENGRMDYVPDADGNLIEYWMDGVVHHENEDKLASKVVSHTEERTVPTEMPQYSLNDDVYLQTEEGEIHGNVIAEENPDGLITIQSEQPIGGRIVNQFTREQLDGMTGNNAVENIPVQGNNAGENIPQTPAVAENEMQPADIDAGQATGENVGNQGKISSNSPAARSGDEPTEQPTSEPMPVGEDGEEDWQATTPERAHAYIFNEAGLSRSEGNEFIAAQTQAAQSALVKAKSAQMPRVGTSIKKYNEAKAKRQEKIDEAQRVLDYWNGVREIQNAIQREENERRAAEDAVRHDEAVAEAQADYEARKRAEAERKAVGNENPMPAITEKWNNATKVDGHRDEIRLPDGTPLKGHYVLHESGASSPSHNPETWQKTDGFPMDANDNSVNDRDYERDHDAQEHTQSIARQYDQRALQSVPVVSNDGVVLSGNGRTMAGELAARDNTDGAYVNYLKEYAPKFGFTAEQVGAMQHPRVSFVPDEAMPYTAETFAKFNQQEMKSQNKTEQAVKLGKTVSDDSFKGIVRTINGYDTLGDFYNDAQASLGAVYDLHNAGVVPQAQLAEMVDGVRGQEKLSAVGREFLENMLIGKAFESDPEVVRMLTAEPAMRQTVITALGEVVDNIALGGDWSLQGELADAVKLCFDARQGGAKYGEIVSTYARQGVLFADPDELQTIADFNNATMLMLADVLNDKRVTLLKTTLQLYNNNARQSAAGQADLFTDGIQSRDDILRDVITFINENYGKRKEIEAARAAAVERRKAESVQQDGTAPAVNSGSKDTGRSERNETFVPVEEKIIDPRSMSGEERARRGEMLRQATAIEVTPNSIVSTSEKSARKVAEEWWDSNVGEPQWYDTEAGEVEINRNSIESSLAHRYGQMKLDAITSLVDGFGNAVYLGTMPDTERRKTQNHYFAYPIIYNGKRCYVFCRALHDNNTNRLYVHEVYVEDGIKKGNTLQTAASKPHGGITLYRDILANVLDAKNELEKWSVDDSTTISPAEVQQPADTENISALDQSSAGKVSENSATLQGKGEKVAENQSPIQGLDGYTEDEVLSVVREDIERKLEEAGLDDVSIKGMALHGSRLRGDARKDSDLDVVVEYAGDINEDGLFNVLNEDPLELEGIRVDINPITRGKSGTLEQYMERSRRYDAERLGGMAAAEPQRTQPVAEEQSTRQYRVGGDPNAVQAALAAAEQETNTEPTEAQKEAGNYKKGHVKIDGYDVTIENPKGSVRRGTDASGKQWEQEMQNTYGYIRGTEGVDGDHIDVFFSEDPSQGDVFVVDQVNKDGSFDEHKVMYGFPDIESARKAYLSNYEDGWQGLGAITPVSKEEFKKWINSSHRKTKPFAEYSSVKPLGDTQLGEQSKEPTVKAGEDYVSAAERIAKENEVKRTAAHFAEETQEEAAAFDKRVPEMDDAELLAYMQEDGMGDVNKAFHPSVYDEYDYRHGDEQMQSYDDTLVRLNESGTTLEQAEEMLGNLRSDLSRLATEDRAELLGQEEALDEYIAGLEPKPIGRGVFGNIYDQFRGRLKEAFDFLIKHKSGDLLGVFHRDGFGDIDLVWGDKGGGAEHIIDKHVGEGKSFVTEEEAFTEIDRIIKTGKKDFENGDKVVFKDGNKIVTVRKNWREKGKKIADKNWVLTAYDETSADSESPVATNKSLAGSATSVSAGKGTDLFGNEQGKVKKSSSETKIDDVGEVLAGARKDMRKEIAKSLANVTEAALVEKPFGKVYKKPDLKKAVESGALREKDAIFYEALFSMVNQQKPKVTQSEMRSKRYIPDFKTKAERWAAATFKQMEVLRHFMELDEAGRDAMMEQMLADRYPTREQELAEIEKRKGWNPDYEGHKYEWGEMTTPNPLWVTHEVMNRLGYSVGDKLDVPYGVVKANTSGTGYSIENVKGERASLFGSGMTLDEAIDRIVYLAKLKRGDADVSHPTQLFAFPATKSESGESGRYRVMWGRDYKTREFDSKEEADAFAQTKSGAYVSPIMETKRKFGYKVRFTHPLTGEKMFVDDTEFDTKEEAQAYFDGNFEKLNEATNAKLQEEREKKGEKKTLTADDVVHVTMVHSAKGGWTHAVVIDKKYANNDGQVRIIKEGFASRKDAKSFADSVKDDVLKTVLKHKEDAKKIVYFDTGENSRIGEDYRNGKNVDAEDFMNTFGFRGVQFGNWTNQADRQMAVNQAYDAFMDIARLIGVSPKAMSLNGELGIAFGARGVGGFAAHYEPGEVVINLTKTQGAGSLAHEWWHALDNYFARRAGSAGDMVTDNRRIEMRDALRKAFNDMLDLVNGSDYAQRSAAKGEYWGRTHEITARLLAEWVDRELKKRGELNTFLSRGAVVERGQQHNYDVYEVLERLAGREPMPFEDYRELPESLKGIPYPSAKEVEQFGGSLRHIFDTLEEKVDEETGNVMLYEPTATYETRDGGKVVCRSLFDEMGVRDEGETTETSPQNGEAPDSTSFNPSELRLRKLKKGETCHVERVYEETKQFDFTGKEKVESAEDVAYIFRQLENAAVENSFLVLVKDGRPTVIHLGVGSYANVMAPYEQALVAYRELKPEQVYFVHNHPSGVLKASRQDQELLKRVKMAFGEDVVQQGIIIDTTSGKYGEFDMVADNYDLVQTSGVEVMPQSEGADVPVKVYQFSRQVFAPDWNPESAFKIVSTQSVAEFVSSHRLGEHKKMSFLVVNNSGNVVANVFLPWTKLSDIKRSKDAGDLLAGYVHQCGGVRGVLYGNYDYEADDRAVLAAVGGRMRQLNAPLMDALHVEHSAYESGWAGVGEPGVGYGVDARDVAQSMDDNNGTEVVRFIDFLRRGRLEQGESRYFHVGETGDILNEYGISGKITIGTSAVNSHHNEDADHLDENDWVEVIEKINEPVAITEYSDKGNSYRIYTIVEKNGKNICVGVDVNSVGRDVNITNIRTAFARDIANALNERLVYPHSRTELETAIRELSLRHNREVYPEQPFDAANIRNNSETQTQNEENLLLGRDGEDELPKQSTRVYSAKERREHEAYAERQWRRAHEVANEIIDKLNISDDITVYESIDEVPGSEDFSAKRRRSKGWYDPRTNKIVVVLGNHRSPNDVLQTILHEAVAHYGLRKLFGKNFETFLDNVYKHADMDVRRRIINMAANKGWDIREATEEYLASLAEDTDFDNAEIRPWAGHWFNKIKQLFLDMLHHIGLRDYDGVSLSDNELRYILWRSYKNLAEPGHYHNYFSIAEDTVMQSNMHVGDFAEETGETIEQTTKVAESGLMFRDGDFTPRDRAIARDTYERMVSTGGYQFQEAVQDSMLGLKRLYQSILGKGTRMEDVDGFENAYLAENRMSSVNAAEQHEYYVRFMKPLLKAISDIAGANNGKRQELTDYMMAKHGLERNVVMAQRDFDAYQQQYPNGTKTLDDFRERDYAGLTALTGEDDTTMAELAAQQMVDTYEQDHDTSELWQRVNDATSATLAKIYNSGLLSKERYEQIQKMFEYYIPLQGWDETTSDEVYGYLTSKNGPLGGSPIKHAKGRSSKADDPIATIALMADDAIRQGNRNKMKQTFLNFVLNHQSDLVSVNDLWLQYNAALDEWEPVFADIEDGDTAADVERKVEAFEERMRQLAESDPDNYKHGRDAQNIPYKVVKGNLKEHQVLVRRNGRTYVLTINGNPRASQALNGLTNPDVETGGVVGNLMQGAQWLNRNLSAFYTTRNPDFVASNFLRDMLYSNCMTWVKESPKYALRFHKNFGRVNPARMRILLGKWENGTLDESNYIENLFKQFMLNGGETGYTNIKDIDGHKREIASELKRNGSNARKAWQWLGEQLDLLNGSAENCARFAAFVTSREEGRSIERSIYDAKEISVNFNKKGSGGKMVNATGQTLLGKVGSYVGGGGRLLYVFWNAGVQGTTNFARAAKRNPIKATAGAASMFMLGAVIPLLAQAMGGDDDDDKNAYYNLPEYVRRSNIIINAGNQWIAIPLPIEFRAFYGLGELATGVITGNERYSDSELAFQMGSQISQILPLDMLEGGGGINPFIPSIAKPFVEAYIMNKSWTGLPVYKDSPWNKNNPEWTKAYKSANTYLVSGAKWLNEISGGDDYKKGFIDINPAKVEYLLSGMFGGAFTTVDKLVKMGETIFSDREFDWRNMLIANRVVKTGDERTANRKLSNEYFKYKDEYEETKQLLKKYSDEAATNERYKHRLERLQQSDEYLLYDVFDNYQPILKSLQDAKDGADEATLKSIENEENALRKDMVGLMHAIEDDKNPDINAHVDAMLKREFEARGRTQKPAGSRIAKRLGGTDSYGSPQNEYGQVYLQMRDYIDLVEDVLIQVALKKAKDSGDTDRAKDIESARRQITEVKKDLAEVPYTLSDGTEVTAIDIMLELRDLRKNLMGELGITTQQQPNK